MEKLTKCFRFEEWGDPRNLDIYEVMKTYCPYTNIDGELLAQNKYPDLLVVGGMNDPRVAFFEPLKFVAKMRGERRKWAKVLKENGAYLFCIMRMGFLFFLEQDWNQREKKG